MHEDWKKLVWLQLGAAIDTLGRAIEACPEHLWADRSRREQLWYFAFHTTFWLDFYTEDSAGSYRPPEPFGLEELDPNGAMPPRAYSKGELLGFLEHARNRIKQKLAALTEADMLKEYHYGNTSITVGEKFFYIMRHTQHHSAQMNLLMRQAIDAAPRWVFRAKDQL